jgi:hypothetical protein
MKTFAILMLAAALTFAQEAEFNDNAPDSMVPEMEEVEVIKEDEATREYHASVEIKDPQEALREASPEEVQDALDSMAADQEYVKNEQARLIKNMKKKAEKKKKLEAGFDRFAALQRRFGLNMQSSESEDESKDDSSEDESSEDKSSEDNDDDSELDETNADTHADDAPVKADKKEKKKRHTMPEPKFKQPVEYSPVPVGDAARKADAHLASGADADRKEDWAVNKATYKVLHPSAAQKKKAKKAKKKMKQPKPLKEALKADHHSIATIAQTKDIIHTPLVKLTLKEAKTSCGKTRTQVKKMQER